MNTRRPYVMRARADSAAQTHQRILEAAIALAERMPLATIALPDIAAHAGVSVQTMLRQFGSKDELFDAAATRVTAGVQAERTAPTGDFTAAMAVLLDHYEARGDSVLLLLGQETFDDRAARITSAGKSYHREWVQNAFAYMLDHRTEPEKREMIDMLVVVTDVYAWKLLRRDRGLAREDVENRMLHMAAKILAGGHHG